MDKFNRSLWYEKKREREKDVIKNRKIHKGSDRGYRVRIR